MYSIHSFTHGFCCVACTAAFPLLCLLLCVTFPEASSCAQPFLSLSPCRPSLLLFHTISLAFPTLSLLSPPFVMLIPSLLLTLSPSSAFGSSKPEICVSLSYQYPLPAPSVLTPLSCLAKVGFLMPLVLLFSYTSTSPHTQTHSPPVHFLVLFFSILFFLPFILHRAPSFSFSLYLVYWPSRSQYSIPCKLLVTLSRLNVVCVLFYSRI